ncbi:hypothetical protein TNCV_167491, partial [Trichonephila clavipes]
MAGWQNPALRERYIQWTGGRNMSFVRGISNDRVAELCPASGCPGGRSLPCVRGMYSDRLAEWQNSVLRQGYVQWPGGRTLYYVRGMSSWRVGKHSPLSEACPMDECHFVGMSSGLVAELCPASGVCLVSEGQNFVLFQGHVQWMVGRNLSCVRGILIEWVAELYPASG